VSAGRKNHLFFEIDGADASISWDQEDPNWLAIGRRDEPNDLLPRDPALLRRDAAPLAHYPPGHQEGWPDALTNLFVDFYAAVAAHRAGASYEPSFASFEQAHHITLAVEAVLASDTDGGWQGVGTEGQTEGVHS
jgi:predicted dehydrogenase